MGGAGDGQRPVFMIKSLKRWVRTAQGAYLQYNIMGEVYIMD
jgi:hypothetical protein